MRLLTSIFAAGIKPMKVFSSLLICMTILAGSFIAVRAQDTKAEDVISKNLAAIGSKEARAGIKNQLAVGSSEFKAKLPATTGGGRAIVVSNPDNFYFLVSFNSKEYPFEKIGYFNGQMSLPFVTAGTRSPLGAFIAEHEKILSDGMFNGSMSARWGMLDKDKRKGKLMYGGVKKIEGRQAHMLEYYPADGGSAEFLIRLYFDAETYNHVRSDYRHEVAAKQDTFGTLGRQAGAKLILTEDFSDFKPAGGLNLPHGYKAVFSTSSNSGLFEYTWGLKIAQYLFNQNLAADFFTFDVK